MIEGRKLLSDIKLYSDYLKYDEVLRRYETWEEACKKVLDTHIDFYGQKVRPLVDEVLESYQKKEILASQRCLQFRGKQVLKNHARLYNCCTSYAYSPDVFNKGFFVLLSGCGLGVSLRKKYVSQLPRINSRNNKAKVFIIPDSIEGWSEAVKVLLSSYCLHPSLYEEYFGYQIKFDFSQIRPKGAYITGGFKAPGPEGLKLSLEKIEQLYEKYLDGKSSIEFSSIIAYDTFMFISDAVLSGGVRRSAMSIIMDPDDTELINAKIGNWRYTNPQRARSNNSVALLRGSFSLERFKKLVSLNQGDNDVGFVFVNHEDEVFNPCFEIGFNFYEKIKDKNFSAFQFCNLTEINASACKDEDKFYELCRKATIIGTLQAGYTNFPYLGKETEEIVKGEALLGVSITGWMNNPKLFNPEMLKNGAEITKKTNEEVAKILGINLSARITTVKPSGNASVILGTGSGIHPEHSRRYFRVIQLNKETEVAKYLRDNFPEMIEESKWSQTNTDYVAFIPIENPENTIVKSQISGVEHLKLIKLVQENWVMQGKRKELCYFPTTSHNVSNTVIVDNINEITNYIFENIEYFTAVSFISSFGDKDYAQAPFTSVLNSKELLETYGDGVLFMSGLIVDGLHHFNNDLWFALNCVNNPENLINDNSESYLLRNNWIKRVKKFSKNYLKNNLNKTIYCMKDVYLWHKWNKIKRNSLSQINIGQVINKPQFSDISDYAAVSCNGGKCEI